MAKLDTSVAQPPSLAETSLPKIGTLAALGAALITPACASTRQPAAPTPLVGPMLTPAQVAEHQATQQGRAEFARAQGVARSLGITNFVYVASNGKDYANFSQVESLSGDASMFQKSAVRITEKGKPLEFTIEGYEQWKSRQVASVSQQGLKGVIIDLDGRVFSVSDPSKLAFRVEPFLVLRSVPPRTT